MSKLELLRSEAIAEEFGLTRGAMYARRGRGDFPPAIVIGRTLYWRRQDVERWVLEHAEDDSVPVEAVQ